jgi:hypothetical protein
MQVNYMGTVVNGSANLQTSVAGAEILVGNVRHFNVDIINQSDCHMSINGGMYIFIPSGFGKSIDVCNSIKIQENGVTFTWTGTKA